MITCAKCSKDVAVRRMTMHLFDGVLRYFCNSECKEQYLKERVENEVVRIIKDTTGNEA